MFLAEISTEFVMMHDVFRGDVSSIFPGLDEIPHGGCLGVPAYKRSIDAFL